MLIRDALRQAAHGGVARLDAQLLLLHVLTTVAPTVVPTAAATAAAAPMAGAVREITRSWLLAHDGHVLTSDQQQAWGSALKRRAAGEPLAYIVGEQPFCGLPLRVTPAVLIPRPETEGLVAWAVECLRAVRRPQPRVLDLGTGSGAVALAIKHRCPHAQVWATDISAAALAVAAGNAQRLQLAVTFLSANWWAPGPAQSAGANAEADASAKARANADADAAADADADSVGPFAELGPFDVVVSNPPYIAAGDGHLAALQHEPITALVGGDDDGLANLRQIINGSKKGRLAPGAWLLLEHGHDQAHALHTALLLAGFERPETRTDLAGLPRCTGARWPLRDFGPVPNPHDRQI